jgi:transposase
MTMLADQVDVVIGVDTHKHTNTVAVVRAATGGVLDEATVPTTPAGHEELLALARSHGPLRAWAIEGTSSYGTGLTRFLRDHDEWVFELERPARTDRRGGKKNDPLDAARSAREALARPELGEPRSTGDRSALAVLMAARRSAIDGATVAEKQILAILIAAPEALRGRFRKLTTTATVTKAARMRIPADCDTETLTTTTVVRSLARRVIELRSEAKEYERALTAIIRRWRPDLLEEKGVGPIVAATVLCSWSHRGRFRSEAAFASLAGVAPVPASSGLTVRHRLNRRGDRQLNRALHTVVLSRVQHDEETRVYVERRRAEGKTDREIKRCLKRYVARRLYRQLESLNQGLDET